MRIINTVHGFLGVKEIGKGIMIWLRNNWMFQKQMAVRFFCVAKVGFPWWFHLCPCFFEASLTYCPSLQGFLPQGHFTLAYATELGSWQGPS